MKRNIRSEIKLQDGCFGLHLNLQEHIPSGCSAILVKIIKETSIETRGIFLPHQIYHKDLKEWSEDGKYQVTFEPHYKIEAKNIFEEKE